jgi:hypothetical protein
MLWACIAERRSKLRMRERGRFRRAGLERVRPFAFYGRDGWEMLNDKWRRRLWRAGRLLLYLVAVIYLLMLYDKISSMQSGIDSIQSDVSSIESDLSGIADGGCANPNLCR